MQEPTADQPAQTPRRRNMRAKDREAQILSEAVSFFAECGFEGQTRELAKRMGISHAVIYRHFESKDALIERVYDQVYVKRWNPAWEDLVLDRNRSLKDRLTQFYIEYAERVFDYNWVRIFVSSGLKSYGLSERYLDLVSEKLICPAARELRFERNEADPDRPLEPLEIELFWGLHGSIFYIAIRKFVYNVVVDIDVNTAVTNTVNTFFDGVSSRCETP